MNCLGQYNFILEFTSSSGVRDIDGASVVWTAPCDVIIRSIALVHEQTNGISHVALDSNLIVFRWGSGGSSVGGDSPLENVVVKAGTEARLGSDQSGTLSISYDKLPEVTA